MTLLLHTRLHQVKACIELLRPVQWLKNVFVLAPLFFGSQLLSARHAWPALLMFLAFCMLSSSVYCLNDIRDADEDRCHPVKCRRPIASGRVSQGMGYVLMAVCLMLWMLCTWAAGSSGLWQRLFVVTGVYWLLNLVYCFWLKRYAIVDVVVIATGFVLRVLAGGLATGIWVSQWLVLMTFLLCTFLALGKRYDDALLAEEGHASLRRSMVGYNAMFIGLTTSVILAVTMVCYIMYALSDEVAQRMGTPLVYTTFVWVFCGLLRYMQNMVVRHQSGSPTRTLLHDRFIMLCVVGWMLHFFLLLYLRVA